MTLIRAPTHEWVGHPAPASRTTMKRRENNLRGAFTLVELLVVIGIVALLIGLLLPALSVARANSRAVACLSNLRQMAVAAQAYCNDHKGTFPVAYWTVSNDPVYVGYNWDFTVVRDTSAGMTTVRPGLLWQ